MVITLFCILLNVSFSTRNPGGSPIPNRIRYASPLLRHRRQSVRIVRRDKTVPAAVDAVVRSYREIRKAREEFQGSALMDFFVDPTQLFASERHPALQEVLKVLSRSKMHRGIERNCSKF